MPIRFRSAKGVLTIGFDPEFEDHLGLVDNARNHTLLQTKLAELGHANAQIKFVKAEAPAGRSGRPPRTGPRLRRQPPTGPKPRPKAATPTSPGKEKSSPGRVQQERFQERPADPKGPGNFQRPDRRSPRLS